MAETTPWDKTIRLTLALPYWQVVVVGFFDSDLDPHFDIFHEHAEGDDHGHYAHTNSAQAAEGNSSSLGCSGHWQETAHLVICGMLTLRYAQPTA